MPCRRAIFPAARPQVRGEVRRCHQQVERHQPRGTAPSTARDPHLSRNARQQHHSRSACHGQLLPHIVPSSSLTRCTLRRKQNGPLVHKTDRVGECSESGCQRKQKLIVGLRSWRKWPGPSSSKPQERELRQEVFAPNWRPWVRAMRSRVPGRVQALIDALAHYSRWAC